MYEAYYDALEKSDLCNGIPMTRYERFLQQLKPTIKHYQKGDFIVREGDLVDFNAIIVGGTVLQKRDNVGGTQSVYGMLREGHSFGMAIIMLPQRRTWPYDYIAKTNCTLLIFAREDIERELYNPQVFTNEIFVNWVRNVSTMVERNVIALRSLRNITVRQKIAAFACEMYDLFGKMQFEIPFNREELAAFLNMPQSSLSREMASMKQDGIIDFHKSTIKILDFDALKNK